MAFCLIAIVFVLSCCANAVSVAVISYDVDHWYSDTDLVGKWSNCSLSVYVGNKLQLCHSICCQHQKLFAAAVSSWSSTTGISISYVNKPTGYNPPQEFLMLMYRKEITYLAYKIADAIADYDYYVIDPIVNITPDNSLSQTYPQFTNAIVVIGVQTDIYRNYDVDSMIQGKPDEATVNPLKPANYSYSISAGIPPSISVGFSWTPTNKVSRTSTFDAGYFNNFYGGQNSTKNGVFLQVDSIIVWVLL